MVRKTPSKHNPNGGFGRGFDRFVEGCVWRHGTCLNRRIFKELELAGEARSFSTSTTWSRTHHTLTLRNTRYSSRESTRAIDFIRDGNPKPIGKMIYGDGPKYELTDRDIQHLVDLYDDEILYFDDVFRSLIQELETSGFLEDTLIVFTSDHGEEFLEHGHISHCRGVWDTVTHVPLFFKIPGVVGQRFDVAVQNLDILPTVLDYLAIDGQQYGFEGRSLRPVIEGRQESSLYAFSKQTEFHSSDDGRFHLILDTDNDRFTLFDIRNDPLEQYDLFDPSYPELGPLKSALDGWLEQTSKRIRLHESIVADRAKEEELRALGYLE